MAKASRPYDARKLCLHARVRVHDLAFSHHVHLHTAGMRHFGCALLDLTHQPARLETSLCFLSQSAGARAVPILYDMSEQEIKRR